MLRDFVFGDLRILFTATSATIRVDWRGRSNHRDPRPLLAPVFDELTSAASSRGVSLDLHFEDLEFFNSSTITAILHHLRDLRDKKVKVTLWFNDDHTWQKAFFNALWTFEKDDGLFRLQPIKG